VISSQQRPLPDNIQHSQQTDRHVHGGIRTHYLSMRAAAEGLWIHYENWSRHSDHDLKTKASGWPNMAIGLMGYAELGYKTELKVNSRGNNGEKSGEIKNICWEIHSCQKYYISRTTNTKRRKLVLDFVLFIVISYSGIWHRIGWRHPEEWGNMFLLNIGNQLKHL